MAQALFLPLPALSFLEPNRRGKHQLISSFAAVRHLNQKVLEQI
jgi:hypothetical protein